ncbi:hypothetical protein HZA86_03345 [Candidatus Uhrbacteria bacterium]|nr:hypothetical protein [Candidatus Uhrbacteria bacterium]
MDILSHGLWAAAGAKGASGSSRLGSSNKKLNPYWAFFWGMFPDLFAFAIPVVWVLINAAMGTLPQGGWPGRNEFEPSAHDGLPVMKLATTLYQYSHSAVVFTGVLLVVCLIARSQKWRFPLEMLGWPLHILMDIPTHSYRFFPTPVLWPISQWKFDGVSWAHPLFITVDYGLLVIVFLLLRKRSSTVIPAREPESRNDRGSSGQARG